MPKRFTIMDCKIIDPFFGVFREGDSTDGAFSPDWPPPNADAGLFEVWDAESYVITVPLPFPDACWVADALNKAYNAEL